MNEDGGGLITEELVAWACRRAEGYIARYGDRDGTFEPSAVEGLLAALRTFDPSLQPKGFEWHAKRAVRQSLANALRCARPLGYRSDAAGVKMRSSFPVTEAIGPWHGTAGPSAEEPVGWELDFEDYVESLVRGLRQPEADAIRLLFLRCEGGSFRRAGLAMGMHYEMARQHFGRAIGRIRRRLGVA